MKSKSEVSKIVKQNKNKAVVIGSSALQFSKGLFRFSDLMQVVPAMAFDVFLCLAYQVDVYFLATVHLFCKEEDYAKLFSEVITDLKSNIFGDVPAEEVVARFQDYHSTMLF